MDIEELLELENAGWRSLCDGTAADFYDGVMTDDGVMVLANGAAMTRAEVATSLTDAPTWDRYEIDDARMISLVPDAAVLLYRGTAWRDSDPPFAALMSSTYVRDGSRLRLALYQQTPVA
jgi:hypothetical protein